jgi:CubicO group peptidase (beta-lactamase class C family)
MTVWRREPEVEPAAVGMDGALLEEMAGRFGEAAERGGLFSGAQMALYRHGRLVLDVGGGVARRRTGAPVTPETLFVIFGSTKGPAALAMWMLHERGAFDFDDPVVTYWPSFASQVPEKAAVTIRHVMGTAAAFPRTRVRFTARWWGDRRALIRAMEEAPLRWTPGEANGYHALNFGWVLNEPASAPTPGAATSAASLREEAFAPLASPTPTWACPMTRRWRSVSPGWREPEEALGRRRGRRGGGRRDGGRDMAFRSEVGEERHQRRRS